MKIQNLALIFIVIILPILLILGYYFKLQEDTLELQSTYDTKLSASVKEGIRAYEINTVNWRESNGETRRNVSASMNTFLSSLANNMGISGTAREYMVNYVPAVAMTMYDGYYIYAPAYVSETVENDQGIQLYFDGAELTTSPTKTTSDGVILNEVAYKPSNSAINRKTAWYTYMDKDEKEQKKQYTFTTDAAQAEKTYEHSLSNEIAYSGTYQKGDVEVTINYTLDNRVHVYGKDGSKDIKEQGCLVAFTEEDANSLPRIQLPASPKKQTDIIVKKGVNESEYMGSNINSEILTEQILYKENSKAEEKLGTFKYIYDVTGKKLYYDEDREEFFTVATTDKVRNYLPSDDVKAGSNLCSYKSVSVLVERNGEITYKKLYQVLNGMDKGKWYINLKDLDLSESEVGPDVEVIDTEIKGEKRKEFGFTAIYRDYSAVSYYVEAYAFTNWIGKRLGGEVTQTRIKFNEETKKYESERVIIKTETREGKQKGIFEIDTENDMEKEYSLISEHKREIMMDSINSNLNLAISNYSRNSPNDYRLPVLQASDWDQIFKNISMIAFFQGVPIGLKTYNNYAIVTSTQNRDYVDPDEIFFSSNALSYHRPYCTKLVLDDIKETYRGYRSVEYTLRTYEKTEGNIYYYQHTKQSVASKNSDLACYSCIINKENYERIDEKGTLSGDQKTIRDIQAKAYKEALARERYYQNEELAAKLFEDINIYVTKKKVQITNTDIIFVLDASGSMSRDVGAVQNACYGILEAMLGEGLSSNFYIGFVQFANSSTEIGTMTSASQLAQMKNDISTKYHASGGTYYTEGLKKAVELIGRDLSGSTNTRIVVFMTDGVPHDGPTATSYISTLKNSAGVDGLFVIKYGSSVNVNFDLWVDQFDIGEVWNSNAANINETFKNILYQINEATPETEKSVDGKFAISDMEISDKKPMEITVRKSGIIIKQITITSFPVSKDGVVYVEGGKMYLSLEKLAEECGLENLNEVEVSISYFVNN